MAMKRIFLDKISSVTKNASLSHDVWVMDSVVPAEGAMVAVEVLEDKKIYNQLELVTGRMSTMKKGDLLAVALGNRRALKGFVGNVPEKLALGDVMQVLNLGGVAGICLSENFKEVGHALNVRVLGAIAGSVLSGKSREEGAMVPSPEERALNIKDFTIFTGKDHLEKTMKLIIVSGTCMNVGKTSVACEIIKQFAQKGKKIFAAKLTGVAAMRDIENMRDYGAREAVSFVDAGYASTVANGEQAVRVTKGALDYLASYSPDYIVVEFGDGVYGEYGVMGILKDSEIQAQIVAHIGCAHDPMGAVKLAEVCHEIGAPVHMISGPVTDNSVGTEFIERMLSLPAYNALSQGEALTDYLLSLCLK